MSAEAVDELARGWLPGKQGGGGDKGRTEV